MTSDKITDEEQEPTSTFSSSACNVYYQLFLRLSRHSCDFWEERFISYPQMNLNMTSFHPSKDGEWTINHTVKHLTHISRSADTEPRGCDTCAQMTQSGWATWPQKPLPMMQNNMGYHRGPCKTKEAHKGCCGNLGGTRKFAEQKNKTVGELSLDIPG